MKTNAINLRATHTLKEQLKSQAKAKNVSLSKHVLDEITKVSVSLAEGGESGHIKSVVANLRQAVEYFDKIPVALAIAETENWSNEREAMEISKVILAYAKNQYLGGTTDLALRKMREHKLNQSLKK